MAAPCRVPTSGTTPWLLAFVVATTFAATAGAATIRVPADRPTLQAALEFAAAGDTVLVAAGVYTGPGNRDLDFDGDDIVLCSESGAGVTVIDAGGSESDPHRCFEFHRAESPAARVEGFTLTGGWVSSPYPEDMGGAVLCRDDAAPTFTDCCFDGNSAYGVGGALAVIGATPTIQRCTFTRNEVRSPSGDGGAIYCWHATLTLEDSAFFENRADEGGGVAVATASNAVIRRCVFAHNEATTTGLAGSGVIAVNAYATIASCTFSANVTGIGGYTVAVVSDAGFVERNIIAGATGNGLYCSNTTYCDCCDVWNSAGENFVGGYPGTRNFSADPEFCMPEALDFTLRQSSPCAGMHAPTGCGLIGALDVGCGPVAIEPATWGRIKASYVKASRVKASRVKASRVKASRVDE